MKVGKTSSVFIRNSTRFDGNFHLSDGVKAREIIMKVPYKLYAIGDVTSDVYCPGIFHRHYVNSGVPFLGGSDILKADYSSGKYLRKETTPNHKILSVNKGWTLVTCGGTIGETAFVNKDLAKCWLSQHIMRLVPNDRVKEGVLYAYCTSRYGKLLITTNTYGSIIPTLDSSSIKTIPIPDFPAAFQKQVDDLIQESARLREEATEALDKAVLSFDEHIGKSIYESSYQQRKISYEDVLSFNVRFDSQYNIGTKIIEAEINNLGVKVVKLSTLLKDIRIGNRSKRLYVDDGIPFLSSSDILLANPLRGCKHISYRTPDLSEMIVKKGTILISRSGTVGNTVIVGDNLNNVAISEHAMKLVTDTSVIEPEYIFAFFNSSLGKKYLQILPYGSVIITLGEEYVGKMLIPMLDEGIRNSIIQLIKQYTSCCDKSSIIENQAIDLIETEIEKWNK